MTPFQSSTNYSTRATPVFLWSDDLNKDGTSDLIVANRDANHIGIFLANANGVFQPDNGFGTGTSPTSVVSGDFNRDGIIDLVVAASDNNTVLLYLGIGGGVFQISTVRTVDNRPLDVRVADLNNDNFMDFAVVNFLNTLSTITNNGEVDVELNNGNCNIPKSSNT